MCACKWQQIRSKADTVRWLQHRYDIDVMNTRKWRQYYMNLKEWRLLYDAFQYWTSKLSVHWQENWWILLHYATL
jgi:hypothetical protein